MNLPPVSDWLDAFPREDRQVLHDYGAPPDADPRAAAYNAGILDLAHRGLQGDALAEGAARLFIEIFAAAPTKAANAEHVRDLLEVNRAGAIAYLAIAVIKTDGLMHFFGRGGFDPAFAMRAIGAVADIVDGTATRAEFTHRVATLPPRAHVDERRRRLYRAAIGAALRDLGDQNDRGELAGAVVVGCGPAGAAYHLIGSIPPRPTARLLRKLCDVIAQESGVRQHAGLAQFFKDEE